MAYEILNFLQHQEQIRYQNKYSNLAPEDIFARPPIQDQFQQWLANDYRAVFMPWGHKVNEYNGVPIFDLSKSGLQMETKQGAQNEAKLMGVEDPEIIEVPEEYIVKSGSTYSLYKNGKFETLVFIVE